MLQELDLVDALGDMVGAPKFILLNDSLIHLPSAGSRFEADLRQCREGRERQTTEPHGRPLPLAEPYVHVAHHMQDPRVQCPRGIHQRHTHHINVQLLNAYHVERYLFRHVSVLKDMMEMSRGVLHHIRGLFLQHYRSGQTRDHLSVGNDPGYVNNLQVLPLLMLVKSLR